MPDITLFVQIQGDARIVEIAVPDGVTVSDLRTSLTHAGVTTGQDLLIFIDEAEDPLGDDGTPVVGVKHGARIHLTRCRRIKTTVHFLEKTIERIFPPGARVRSVKAWATRELGLDHKDAAEHVLQICNSKERPASDTPLQTLVSGHDCVVCFDFVPEKRVEG